MKKEKATTVTECPMCGEKGKDINLLTVKSMLLPIALETLDAHQTYRFCASDNCNVVNFGDQGGRFTKDDVRLPVFQKDHGQDTNVCYYFDWTRSKIMEEIRTTGKSTAVSSISSHIKAGRCGCDLNNPQGSCCLGNVTAAVKEVKQAIQSLA
ncbi:(2Fe-2S)-binding protein [Aneurinibacillus sp. Ricciae_BoGa-3]|nr:(2Fe-2S)-binding protein [Aneurinibacillus sp. Ricciae_BoGa-3]WCK52986.1 (2Fe-2S)-binding protein [Aneurinibacillus sp. Ricciae_BoGa-3]